MVDAVKVPGDDALVVERDIAAEVCIDLIPTVEMLENCTTSPAEYRMCRYVVLVAGCWAQEWYPVGVRDVAPRFEPDSLTMDGRNRAPVVPGESINVR